MELQKIQCPSHAPSQLSVLYMKKPVCPDEAQATAKHFFPNTKKSSTEQGRETRWLSLNQAETAANSFIGVNLKWEWERAGLC